MRKINDYVYAIRKKDLSIVRLQVTKIIITENNISYNYDWADNEAHLNSIWNCLWLRNKGKMLIFDTEEQAQKYITDKYKKE